MSSTAGLTFWWRCSTRSACLWHLPFSSLLLRRSWYPLCVSVYQKDGDDTLTSVHEHSWPALPVSTTHIPSHTRVSLYLQGPNVQSNVTFLFYEDFPLSSCLLSVINAVLRLNRTQTLTSGGNILSQELHEVRCGASPRGSLFSSVMCSVVGLYNETSQWNSRNEACRRATPQGPSCCSELGFLQNRVPPLDPLCISDWGLWPSSTMRPVTEFHHETHYRI